MSNDQYAIKSKIQVIQSQMLNVKTQNYNLNVKTFKDLKFNM